MLCTRLPGEAASSLSEKVCEKLGGIGQQALEETRVSDTETEPIKRSLMLNVKCFLPAS